MKNKRKLLAIGGLLVLAAILVIIACKVGNKDEIDESTKYEVDGVIFENDLMRITGVSTDEYLDVFRTKEITYTYFAKDFQELKATNILNIGGTVIGVTPGENYLDELACSVLSVVEDDKKTIITDKLEEFFVCQDEEGNMAVYYEIYHEYAEEVEKDTVKKYLTLKAYKIEFEYYMSDSIPNVEKV